jgi:hypothetical protein
MEPDHSVISPVHAIFDAARHFGLTDHEIWRTFDTSLAEVGSDATVDEYCDELTEELARRILDKHRRTPFQQRRVALRGRL